VHRLAEIIRFRLLMIAAGYEDGNDADALRRDPMFKLALDRLPWGDDLCSQSTISRLENLPDRRALLRLGRALVDQYCGSFRSGANRAHEPSAARSTGKPPCSWIVNHSAFMPGILAYPFERFQPLRDQRLTNRGITAQKGSLAVPLTVPPRSLWKGTTHRVLLLCTATHNTEASERYTQKRQ
jgi:hypothetical protein